MQTQTSNTLYNAIMEAGGKDRPPMLAPGNYVQWNSRIKRYIDTKPNHELIHYYLKNPPYKFAWADKEVLISEGSSVTTTKTYMENYKNVLQDISNQLNAEAEAVQIILTGIDNDIYSIVDACPNACEMWKAIERLKQGESINVQDLETNLYWEFGKFTSRDGESLKFYYSRFYKMMNELVRNQCDVTNHQVNVEFLLQLQTEWQRGKAIVNSPPHIYDQEPSMVAEDDEMSKDKELDKLMALISLSFKKIYKPTNNNLRTLSNTSRENQDNSPRIHRGAGYDNQRLGHVAGARETVEVSPDAVDSGPIFDTEPVQKVPNNDNYNVFAIECEHPEQSKSVHDTYLIEQDEHNVIIDSSDMSYDREQINQNDDDDDLANERELLASLIENLKCEIDDSKNRNKFLETSNKVLVEKLKGEIEDFKNKTKSLESSNNRFKEANNKLSETNKLMYNDLKKSQAELDRRNDVEYALKVEIDCAKAKGDLISYKIESQKSFIKYTQTINDLNQTIFEMKKKLSAHQETISILSQLKEAQIMLYKTREDKELDKVIALENKVKVLDNIVYKTGQSVQTMNMLNNKCRTSFAKPEFLKKAQRANPHLYDIEEMVADMRYFNSLELEVDSLKSQLETQKTQFLNVIDRLLREYYYADHMNAILSVYTELDEVTNLQCDYLELVEKCECLEKELSKSQMLSKSFEALQKHAINLEIDLQQCQEKIKNNKSFTENQSKEFRKERVIPTTSVSRPQLKSNSMEERVLLNNSQGKTQEVEDHRRNVKFSKNKMSITACHDSLNVKTVNVNFVCATYGVPLYQILHYLLILLQLVEIVLFIVDSRCSKHMTGNLRLLINFVEKFLGTMKFRNDQIAPSLGYGDLVQGAVTIKRVYYVEGLNHNLFSIGQFCDADLEVAFRKSTCYICNLKGNDLLTASINGKRYVLVIVDDYSRYTWTPFLRSKDETPEVLIDFLRLVQRGLHAQVKIVRTDKGTEFLNSTLQGYFASEGILHQTSVAQTPEQNGVVKRRNRTLGEAARTMLSIAKVPLFFWAEAIATTCFTQNRYSTQSRAYRVFNKRTKGIVETIHVNFDELPQMALDHVVSKSSAVTTIDAPNQHQQHHTTPLNNQTTPDSTCQVPTQAPTVASTENINQEEMIAKNAQVENDKFINI
nr:integrase, catalytic region, zinc finger, CCHC-type, peptidase aspartic, catalytic [Tanacetum cinerariifolium]